jgi:hypothetical protein
VSLESSLEGLSNGEGNLDLAQLGTMLWDFEIFPTCEGVGANGAKWDKKYIFGWDSPKESFLPS